ncbi:MAG: amidohydrolase family protein, partial [Pseudomonadota bacterium]
MASLLILNAQVLVTMDRTRREIAGGWLFARDGEISALGGSGGEAYVAMADQVIDAKGCLVTPGLVNTHHHLCQNLTRTIAQDAPLFGWLTTLYPIWARMGPDAVRISAMLGLSELALSGCTCSSDHLYLYPNGSRLDDTIDAARAVGVRLHATHGSMSIGESQGGLPPDSLVLPEDVILKEGVRLIDTHHDPRPGAMIRVALAPCSPFSVSQDLMRETALLARDKG